MKTAIPVMALLAAWPFASAKDYQMTAAASVPAATGIVKVERAKENGNMKLDIKVDHLANPASLTPSASKYLVWSRPNGGDAFKQGAIGVDKNLRGELRLETVSRDFDVFITAEQSDSVTVPSSVEVLSAHVSTK
jgi:phage major head subunit gpT-like protein